MAQRRSWRINVSALLCVLFLGGAAAAFWRVDWSAFAPAPSAAPTGEATPAAGQMRTPFAPLVGSDPISAVLASRMAGMRLIGVRVAADPAHSGAFLILADGQERAFTPGQEIAPGVLLAEVGASYIALEFDGVHRRRLALGGGFSAEGTQLADASEAQTRAVHQARAESVGWLMGLLMEGVGGGLDGWTVGAPVPALAARAGLQSGDVIVSVNGVGPEAGAAALGAAAAPVVRLSVRRPSGENVIIAIETGART